MSIFEDVLEVHYNAETRVEGPPSADTIRTALNRVAHDPDDVSVVLDWDTAHEIEDQLMHISVDYDLPESHVETSCDRISTALDTRATVHGTGTGMDFGLVLHPIGINYANEVIAPASVVAIDFTTDG